MASLERSSKKKSLFFSEAVVHFRSTAPSTASALKCSRVTGRGDDKALRVPILYALVKLAVLKVVLLAS